jgi:hypothetical protein
MVPVLADRRCLGSVAMGWGRGEDGAVTAGGATVIDGTSSIVCIGVASYDGRVESGGRRANSFGSLLREVDAVGVIGVGVADSAAGDGRAVPGVLPSFPELLSLCIARGGM